MASDLEAELVSPRSGSEKSQSLGSGKSQSNGPGKSRSSTQLSAFQQNGTQKSLPAGSKITTLAELEDGLAKSSSSETDATLVKNGKEASDGQADLTAFNKLLGLISQNQVRIPAIGMGAIGPWPP